MPVGTSCLAGNDWRLSEKRSNQPSRATPDRLAQARASIKDWPLVGREDEIVLLGMALDAGKGVVIGGPAGVGKSRLARELLEARDQAFDRVIGTAAASQVPLGAFAHLLPQQVAGASDRLSLLWTVTTTLMERTEGAPLALLVDDAQHLDPASAALVLRLAATGNATIVATVRSGMATPEPITSLWKERLATRVDLQPLSSEEVSDLLERALGGPVDTDSARQLFLRSAGNPLYLRELVEAAREAGTMVRRQGLWGSAGGPVGGRLIELVQARLAGLPAASRQALDLLAIAEPLGIGVIEHFVGPDAARDIEERGLAEVLHQDRRVKLRLSHPLYAEVLMAVMSEAERRTLRAGLADFVDESGARRVDDVLRVATWRLEAGETAHGELFATAAQRANDVFDYQLGERLGRAALGAGAGLAAALPLARALRGRNRFADAHAVLVPWEVAAASDPAAASYVVERFAVVSAGLGRSDEAAAFLDRAAAWSEGDAWRQLLLALRCELLAAERRFREVVAVGAVLVEDPAADEVARVLALAPVGNSMVQLGQIRRAEALADGLTSAAQRVAGDVPRAAMAAMQVWIAAMMQSGRATEVESLARSMHETALAQRDLERAAAAEALLGRAALFQGRARTARRWLVEASAHFGESDSQNSELGCLAALSLANALLGDADGARDSWNRAQSVAARRPFEGRHFAPMAQAEAWLQAVEGDVRAAGETAMARAAEAGDDVVSEAMLLHEALRLQAPPEKVAPRLREIAEEAHDDWLATLAAHASALERGDAAELDSASAAFERSRANLLAAEAAAEAAEAHSEAGRKGSASTSAARSESLFGRCEGLRTPALGQARVSPLTARESEIVLLAAGGLSNAEIAERLVLSVRTVESHVYRASVKLGVSRREELADAAGLSHFGPT